MNGPDAKSVTTAGIATLLKASVVCFFEIIGIFYDECENKKIVNQ